MTISKIQVGFKKGDYLEVMAPDGLEKGQNVGFHSHFFATHKVCDHQ